MIDIQHLSFAYPGSKSALLNVAELRVSPGEKIMLRGPSGSGKSTLLNLIGGILTPDSGSVKVCGENLTTLADAARRIFRINRLGFIFQDFALLDYLDVAENILLPYRINPALKLSPETRARLLRLAEALGIADKLRAYPDKLSFGERQRAAIARALIADPQLLIADEPTANLDRANAVITIELILKSAALNKAAVVVVSHDETLKPFFDRVIEMSQFTHAAEARA